MERLMAAIGCRTLLAMLATLVALTWSCGAAHAEDVVVGVNVVNPMRASVAAQDAVFAQLEAAHVHVIRCGISADDKGIDFARRAAAQGIRIQLILGAQYPPNAPSRPYQPDVFPAMWGGHPLSWADPDLSKALSQKVLDELDANGIVLAGMELGNEINWAAFNPEFPLPGEGKILSLADLSHDPEGKQIAKGFLQYLKILAVLKDVRDHSRLNRSTPIISAGMVDAKDGDKLYNNKKEDMVSLSATISFLRANGLDKLVDAYGVHTYSSAWAPGNPVAAAQRTAHFADVTMAECRPAGAKPCWITEWGFSNTNLSCPANDTSRALLVQEMRADFAQAAAQNRLAGVTYFAWDSDPWSKQPDADSVYRCGALMESGRLAIMLIADAPAAAPPTPPLCMDCIRLRLGVPRVARGPAPNIADNTFSEIRLPNGRFRGFTAAATTFAIDGKTTWDMAGPAVTVLKPGPPNSPSSCGQWLQHEEPAGNLLLGWIHNETACDYGRNGQTHASMTIATSADDGLTWKVQGFIITGKSTDKPLPGRMTGESCSGVINGKDGYYYAYCGRSVDHTGYVARAPIADPGPGHWLKYFDGGFTQPGVGGDASNLGSGAGAPAAWLTTGETVKPVWVTGGLGLAFSQDRLHFTALPQPLMKLDNGRWDRKGPPNELLSYATFIDATTGENMLGAHWLMAYMYLQPNEGFDKRYLVFRPIDVTRSRKPDEPAVGVMLTHWYNARLHDHWSTVAPVPGNYSAYKPVAELGYMMTVPDPKRPSVELEECVSQWPGHPDHILIQKNACEGHGYMRLRSAGFVYAAAQPDSQPLFRCYSDAEKSHFAANTEDCNHIGHREALLGYDLKQ
jgi:hypothetical protein